MNRFGRGSPHLDSSLPRSGSGFGLAEPPEFGSVRAVRLGAQLLSGA